MLKKWKVQYELREYVTRVVEAKDLVEAEDIVLRESYRMHGHDVYDIIRVELVCDYDYNNIGYGI